MNPKLAWIVLFAGIAGTASAQVAPTVTGALNAGDFSSHLAPGLLAAVFGANFGSGAYRA